MKIARSMEVRENGSGFVSGDSNGTPYTFDNSHSRIVQQIEQIYWKLSRYSCEKIIVNMKRHKLGQNDDLDRIICRQLLKQKMLKYRVATYAIPTQ